MTRWAPLKMSFFVRHYAFGERLIPEMLGKSGVPDEGRIAETWEISDEGENKAIIAGGEFDGQTLHEVTLAHPEEIVGPGWNGAHFPLLAKFLDASHMLPVHLHADDETARRLFGAPHGKSEAWHILWAEPDASILAGIKPGVSRDELIAAFKARDYAAVMPRYPISAGDTVYVPGGILHSFGPGTLIFEIQQTSDLASDVMPADVYGVHRTDAAWDLAIETTLAQLKTDYLPAPFPGIQREEGGNRFSLGCACKQFSLERWTLTEPLALDGLKGVSTVSNVGGPVAIEYEGGATELARGESCVVPAAIGPHRYRPGERGADLIVCTIPDLMNPIYEPFLARQPLR
jgi:mannose-6-phosphate isomerase